MLNLIKNSIKDIVVAVKEDRQITIPFTGMLSTYETGEVNIRNEAVYHYTKVPPSMPNAFVTRVQTIDGNVTFSIIANTGYEQLAPNLKDALYKHELGHIVCKHMSTNIDIDYESSLENEKEADMYAYELGADMVSWFNYLMLNHPILVSSDPYMIKRIQVFVDKSLAIDMKAFKYCKVLSRLNHKG